MGKIPAGRTFLFCRINCKQGGTVEGMNRKLKEVRLRRNKKPKVARSKYQVEYRKGEEYRQQRRAWIDKNKHRLREYQRQWYKKNREKRNKYTREYMRKYRLR